jgi:hypothetical protein
MLRIELNPQLTKDERAAIAHYLTQHGQLNAQEWLVALRAFDLLGDSTVTVGEKRETFAAIYARLVERKHADDFIEQLLTLEKNVQAEGERLKASVARTTAQKLADAGLYRRGVPESRYLLAYCYYWWDAFARGYIFEVQIYQDLEQSGIEFLAHDIRDPTERRSRSDLIVLGREGDVKTSTYFLATARTQVLRHDFYIMRLYDVRHHHYRIAVMMTEEVWRDVNGDTVPATLEDAASLFPQAARVKYAGDYFIVVDYDVWKQRVKTQQREEYDDREGA